MGVMLGQPWGLLALLGLPAVLAIHLLQRRAVVIPASTLFLLESLPRESDAGRRVERLRKSLPLGLQLLGVLILTWLLTDPQWLEKNSVQRIAVVLDSSASMSVAKPMVLTDLPRDLARLASATTQSEVYLLDSRQTGGPLYHGPEGEGILAALEAWRPAGGTHDPTPALRLARNLAGRDGLVIYVTDAAAHLPPGVRLYACGRPVENAGIAGVTVEETSGQLEWRATLRNYGNTAQTRQWQVSAGNAVLSSGNLTLPPGGLQQQRGVFPPGMDELTLTLSPDAFPMDDLAPVLRPKLKEVTVSLPAAAGPADPLYEALFASLPGVRITTGGAAVPVVTYDPLNPQLPAGAAVIFVRDPKSSAPVLSGTLLVEKHPLTEGLGWQGLVCQDSMKVPLRPEDQPLVWIGDRAVVFLRTAEGAQQLCFNFDLNKSNARRLPALVLTLHRWIEDYRRQWPAEEWTLTECSQALPVAVLPPPAPPVLTLRTAGQPDSSRPSREAALLRAPDQPGVLEVWQGTTRLLRTASHFADVREADFTGKGTQQDLSGATAAVTRQHRRADPAWRGWLLALLGVTGFSWWWLGRLPRPASHAPLSPTPR
jgi:hypothetical protein